MTVDGELASDDLYILDLSAGDGKEKWLVVPVQGPTPGKRYGHTITYTTPYLVVFGGHAGHEPANDTWILSTEKEVLRWEKLNGLKAQPEARLYHSAAACGCGAATGMVVVFGGRGKDQNPLDDSWGLRRHRDGAWEWLKAPYKGKEVPKARYQVGGLVTV